MRVGVVSDTHGRIACLRQALQEMNVDLLLHAGDHYSDAVHIKEETKMDVRMVVGNCDPYANGPEEELVEIAGKKILITHGHQYKVKYTYNELIEKLKREKLDMIIFGHTHAPYIEKVGQGYIFNPGSLSHPRGSESPTYGILEIEKDSLVPHIVHLNC